MGKLILPSQVGENSNILVTDRVTGEKLFESDGFNCCHCNRIIIVRHGSGKKRGFCYSCFDVHCGSEQCWNCRPFEAWLEAMEATGINRRRLWSRLEEGGIKGVY